jgi:hypothetical protein
MYDQSLHRLTALRVSDLEYLWSVPIAGANYVQPIAGPGSTVAVVFDQIALGGTRSLVGLYAKDGTEYGSFARRHPEWETYGHLETAYFVLGAATDDYYALSFGLPYDVRLYDSAGNLVRRFSDIPPFFEGTFVKDGFEYPNGSTLASMSFRDEYVLNFLRDNVDKVWYVDALRVDGAVLERHRIEDPHWDYETYPLMASDDAHVYAVSHAPYPKLVKFRLDVTTDQGRNGHAVAPAR